MTDRLILFLSRWKTWLPVLVVLLAAFGVGLTVDDLDGDGTPDRVIIEKRVPAAPPATAVDGPDKDRKADDALELDDKAQGQLENLTREQAGPDDRKEELDEPLKDPGAPTTKAPGPLAAQEFPGCRTAFVGNSSLRRSEVKTIVWHYTVSRRLPGWSDNDALTAMSNRLAAGVSWHFSIGGDDGLCAFNVPLTLKAWTQANANPFSVGIEVIALGNEAHYVEGAGRAKLLAVTREIGRRYGIPMRRGRVENCRPVLSGIVAHADLGLCGGGHVDVNPWMDEIPGLIAAAKAGACSSRCRKAKVLKGRHERTHAELRRRRCAPEGRTRSARCKFLHGRNHRVHADARKAKIRL